MFYTSQMFAMLIALELTADGAACTIQLSSGYRSYPWTQDVGSLNGFTNSIHYAIANATGPNSPPLPPTPMSDAEPIASAGRKLLTAQDWYQGPGRINVTTIIVPQVLHDSAQLHLPHERTCLLTWHWYRTPFVQWS